MRFFRIEKKSRAKNYHKNDVEDGIARIEIRAEVVVVKLEFEVEERNCLLLLNASCRNESEGAEAVRYSLDERYESERLGV